MRPTWWALHHTSKLVHRLLLLATGCVVVATCLLAGAAWRLAQGPIELGWLSDHVRAALTDEAAPVQLSFGGLSLAWEGFRGGADHPLDLRVSNIAASDVTGRRLFAAPQAHLTFSLAGLLMGRIVPRTVEVDHAQAAVTREAGGAINLGWDAAGGNTAGGNAAAGNAPDAGSLDIRQLRDQLSQPVGSDHGRAQGLFGQIQRIHFRDADVTLRDRGTGIVVQATGMGLDLLRSKGGRVRGLLRAPLAVDGRPADLTAEMDWVGGADPRLDLKLTSPRPVGSGPAASVAAALDAPVALTASIGFDSGLAVRQFQAEATLGQGQVLVGQGGIPLRSGAIALSGTPQEVTITKGRFDVARTATGNPEIVEIGGTVAYKANRLTSSLTVGLGQIVIAGLPQLWPPGIASSVRPWIMEHITGGTATRGTVSAVIESDVALHDVVVVKASGDLDVSNAAFTWIDHVPPVEQVDAHLRLVDPDTLDIHVTAGRQRIRDDGADLVVKDGTMRIAGLSLRDQVAVIHAQVEGPVASALALLREPRLQLLSSHPIGLKIGGGDASATLDFQLPLENSLRIDDVQIHADARLRRLRLLDVAGGHELTEGTFDLGIDKDGLAMKGQGLLAAIPVTLNGSMDFRPGSADQVVQKIVVTGQPDASQLDAAGLHVADVVAGAMPVTAVVTGRRGGDGSVAISADLSPVTLSVGPLAWGKPPGQVASASAVLATSHDRLARIDRIMVRGDGLLLAGAADVINGHVRSVLLDTIRLGRTQGHGTVHLSGGDPIAIVLQGDQIDLAPKLMEKTTMGDRPESTRATTPEWTLNAHFDHATLANGERADDVLVKATGGGEMVRLVDAVGSTHGAGFSIKVTPQGGQRRLVVDAKDAGSFLRGVDAVRTMQSGRLAINGVFSAAAGLYPLAGTIVIDNVVVKDSPVLGKLLQAITLYGLVDALRGPGMGFSQVVVPFRYDGASLDLDQAHAANPSLGLTAKGHIGLSSGQTSMTGTIVPAYFFNAMLGQLPVVGKLFSPEKGGGVFAARFGLEGPNDDLVITLNPVSTLAPGFLREIFGVFDHGPPPADRMPLTGK